MTEILTANFVPESTEDLISKAELILGGLPVTSHTQQYYAPQSIISLAPSCKSIKVKNIITVVDAGIVKCTGLATTTCGTGVPPECPTSVSPLDYINMVATITALAAQGGLTVRFEYVYNGTPAIQDVTGVSVATDGGTATVYAFPTNVRYIDGEELVLYGATIV